MDEDEREKDMVLQIVTALGSTIAQVLNTAMPGKKFALIISEGNTNYAVLGNAEKNDICEILKSAAIFIEKEEKFYCPSTLPGVH